MKPQAAQSQCYHCPEHQRLYSFPTRRPLAALLYQSHFNHTFSKPWDNLRAIVSSTARSIASPRAALMNLRVNALGRSKMPATSLLHHFKKNHEDAMRWTRKIDRLRTMHRLPNARFHLKWHQTCCDGASCCDNPLPPVSTVCSPDSIRATSTPTHALLRYSMYSVAPQRCVAQ